MTSPTVHPGLVENAVLDTLKAWLPSHLARIERENQLEPGELPRPPAGSWIVASEFDLRPHERLPAVFVVSTGKTGAASKGPKGWRAPYGCDVAVAIAAEDETTARTIAGYYLAAVQTSLLWHQTLGGLAESIEWGPQDLAVGTAGRSSRSTRAVFGATFQVSIPVAIPRRPQEEPDDPPPDPLEPPIVPEPFDDADITVTPENLTEELA